MRLESVLERSDRPRTDLFQSDIRGGTIGIMDRWGILISELFGERIVDLPDPHLKPDVRTTELITGFVLSVIDDLVEVSSSFSTDGRIGLSGGVAYDIPIVKAFIGSVKARGLEGVLHSNVPPGDGGISVGQAAIGGYLI
jgi:hydrogenase maturation factor HypF (carbamoyltransferase family)